MIHIVEYLAGVIQVANLFLSLVAGFFAISLFRVSHRTEHLRPWKLLIVGLVLFAIQEILGALLAFGFIPASFVTHVIPTFIMLALLWALDIQIKEYTIQKEETLQTVAEVK